MRRRTFLQAGTALGLGLADLLRHRQDARADSTRGSGRAKACVLIFLTGGAAQQETFDPKPDAPANARGEFSPTATSVPGFQLCEHLPMLARNAHRFSVIRSVWHGSGTHGVGTHYNLTGLNHAQGSRPPGEPQPDRRDPPCIGGAIRQLRGDRNGLPAAVQLPRPIGDQNTVQWAGQHAGFLGPRFDPLALLDDRWIPGTTIPGFTAPADVPPERQTHRTDLLQSLQSRRTEESLAERAYDRFQQQALDVVRSSPAWKAFMLDDEPRQTLDRYGDNRFGRSCLVARRLIEAGVGLVTVPWMNRNSEENFDTHSRHFTKMKNMLLPPVDRALSALLEDLSNRGLLDETLVSVTGEFGRTPRINNGAGRDHWGRVYSTLLSGGGIRGGQAFGRSDSLAGEPADNPVHVSDFFATMYHALGYGTDTRVYDQVGRPHYLVQGRPVLELF